MRGAVGAVRAGRAAGGVAVAVATMLAVSGCGSSSTPAGTSPTSAGTSVATSSGPAATATGSATPTIPAVVLTFTPGLPSSTATPTSTDSFVAWGEKGQLHVVTYGSSSCPRLPQAVTTSGGNTLMITTAPTSSGPCTMDFAPTTSTVAVPAGIDETTDLQVALDDQESTLRPR